MFTGQRFEFNRLLNSCALFTVQLSFYSTYVSRESKIRRTSQFRPGSLDRWLPRAAEEGCRSSGDVRVPQCPYTSRNMHSRPATSSTRRQLPTRGERERARNNARATHSELPTLALPPTAERVTGHFPDVKRSATITSVAHACQGKARSKSKKKQKKPKQSSRAT